MILSPLKRSFLGMMTTGIILGGLGVHLVQKMHLQVVDPHDTLSNFSVPHDVPLIALARAEVTAIDVDTALGTVTGINPAVLEWKDVFAGETPKNLYLKMYDETKNEAGRAAATKVAESIGYSEDDLQKILRFDPTTIATYAAQEQLTYDQAVATFTEVEKNYNDELDMQQLASDMKADIYPVEAFANGTTDDSGFDLIVDLANIEAVLFKNTTITAPGAYAGDSAAGEDPTSSDTSGTDSGSSATTSDTSGTTADSDSASSGSPDGSSGSDRGTTDDATSGTSTGSVDSALACLVDDTLSNAVSTAIADEAAASSADDSGSAAAAATAAALDALPDNGTDTSDIAAKQATFDAIAPETASSWTAEDLCPGDITDFFSFCIEVSFTYNPKTYYKTNDNCIACHFEQMRDRLATVLEKNLTPNKVTGNIMEGSKCTKGFLASGIDLKIIPIAQPLQTPPNDDILVGIDPAATLNSLKNALSPGRPIGSQEKPFDPPLGADAAAQAQQKYAGMAASYQAIADETSEIVGQAEEDAAKAQLNLKFQADLESESDFYKLMSTQMTDMNVYFISFFDSVNNLTKDDSDATCTKLRTKEVCKSSK